MNSWIGVGQDGQRVKIALKMDELSGPLGTLQLLFPERGWLE